MSFLRNLPIGIKLAILGGFMNVVAIVIGLVGYRGETHLDEAVENLSTVQMPAIRAATLCDMMHDNIHGQGAAAVLHGPADAERSRKEAEEAGTELREHVQELLALDLDADLHQECVTLSGMLDAYVNALVQVVEAVAAKRDGRAELAELDAQFEKLATVLDATGRRICERAATAGQLAQDTARSGRQLLLWVALLGTFTAITLYLLIARGIKQPLQEVSRCAERMALGDFSQHVEYSSKDELGRLAESFRSLSAYVHDISTAADALARGDLANRIEQRSEHDVLARNFQEMQAAFDTLTMQLDALIASARGGQLSSRANAGALKGAYQQLVEGLNSLLAAVGEPIDESASVLERIAGRDLTARMTRSYQGDFDRIKQALNSAAANLEVSLGQVSGSADQVTAASNEINSSSQSLARGASEQASALEEISSSLQEIRSMSQQNTANSQEARTLADSATTSAEKGSSNAQRLSDAMGRIKQSSEETAKIVKTIDEIAFQTNLLALNAAVEAARAGDAGKGFAVVAEEVRNLAMRSAEAARTTGELIHSSRSQAEEGWKLNHEVHENLSEIVAGIKKVGTVMGEIAAASEQQSTSVNQVSAAIEQLNTVTQTNAASSEETASAAAELSSQADELRALVATFSLSPTAHGGSRHGSASPAPASDAAEACAAPSADLELCTSS